MANPNDPRTTSVKRAPATIRLTSEVQFLGCFFANFALAMRLTINYRSTALKELHTSMRKSMGNHSPQNPTAVYVKVITARSTTSNEGLSLNFACAIHAQGTSAGNSLGSTVPRVSRGNCSEMEKSCARPALIKFSSFFPPLIQFFGFFPHSPLIRFSGFFPTPTTDSVLWPAVDSILRLVCKLIARNATFGCDDAPTSNHFFSVDVRFIPQGSCPLARQKYWQVRTNFVTLLLYNCSFQ